MQVAAGRDHMPTFNAIFQPALAFTQPGAVGVLPDIGGIPPTAGWYVEGTEGNDRLYGTDLDDGIYGNGGNDTVAAGYGNDLIDGGAGNDFLSASRGDDLVFGGFGTDFLTGGEGRDTLNGGDGFDTASYHTATSAISVDMTAGIGSGGDAQGDTFASIEKILGSRYADVLNGNRNGDDVFDGGAGSDVLLGNEGRDLLIGGVGNDTIVGGGEDYFRYENDTIAGGIGRDVLTGGYGADRFEFRPHQGADVVTDFEKGIDKIALFDFPISGVFNLVRGTNISDADLSSVHDHVRDHVELFYDTDDGKLYHVLETDLLRAELIATFQGRPFLGADDFGL